MRRREFITLLGGGRVAPWGARSGLTARQVAVLIRYSEADLEAKELFWEFNEGFSELGWMRGATCTWSFRWTPGRTDLMRTFANELVGLQPHAILAR